METTVSKRAQSGVKPGADSLKRRKLRNERQAYMMITPQLIGFCVFSVYPILWVFRYAFYDYDGITEKFIFFDNFVRAFTRDPPFWHSILNTFIIAYGKLIIELPLALITALVLSYGALKMKKLFTLCYYLPKVTGVAVNCLIFGFLFRTVNGAVNSGLMRLGLMDSPHNWLADKWSAMAVIMVESLWAGFAANMLYFMAGVQNIPDEVMESAKMDGANKIQTFFKVTLPMLAPIARVILMLAMVSGMKIMNQVLLLTDGGPAGGTNVVMLHLYKQYFVSVGVRPQYGYASALGVITTIIVGVITFIYLKISEKVDSVY